MRVSRKAAKTQQAIKEEDMQVQIVERSSAIDVAKEEAARIERALNASVRLPADAEKYRLEKVAQAEKKRIILEAEAQAEAERVKGEADAYAIGIKTVAEAKQLQKKAAAYDEFGDAARAEMTLSTLPKVAEEVGTAIYDGLEEIKLISTGNGDVGVAKVTGEVLDVIKSITKLTSNITGVQVFEGEPTRQENQKGR
ncbi:unnamed protein product [Enterobius vermicularis]|uniref:Flot domain-containing protein n=1 Tax=Enterobius vermicularis TaxID=51028 RepID=A0A0N4V902_ENTVE|nr:unnamed protein product [Enterobius vermicularis]